MSILILAIMIIIFLIFLSVVFGASGFTMTPELEQEWRVLQICIETDIQLEFCDTRYGAIDKPYGEKIDSQLPK